MTDANPKKFLVLYLIPAAVMDAWKHTAPEIRKAPEEKMHAEWGKWAADHANLILSTYAGGQTKSVTAAGVSDTRNDIVVCSVIEAESHAAAAKLFENHPHLQIPQASIEVMELRPIGGM